MDKGLKGLAAAGRLRPAPMFAHMDEAEGLSLNGVESLFAIALKVCARGLAARLTPLPGLAMPVFQALMRAGLRERTVTEHNLRLFLPSQWLDLSEANHLTDAALREVATTCGTSLTTLEMNKLSSVSPDAVCHLVGSARGLRELTLSRAGCASDELLRTLARNCTELAELDLSKQATLTLAGLSALSSLRHLQRLVLYSCSAVNDDVLLQLCAVTGLRHLSLARCVRVTDRGVCAVAHTNRGLQELIVSYCRNLTDATLAVLRELALTFIDLTSLTAVTEDALCAFFERGGARLRTAYLSFCSGVTPRVAAAVAAHCGLLEKLYLSYVALQGPRCVFNACRLLQPTALAFRRRHHGHCELVSVY